MRYLIYYVIILGVCVIEVSYTVKYVKRILEGCGKLQKISEKRIDAIKLHDFQGGKLNVFSTCFTNIALCGMMCVYFYSWSGRVTGLLESMMFFIYAISIFINAGMGFLVYRHAGECYLTYGGIVKVDWTYGRNECEFATQIEDLKDGKKRLSVVVSNHGSVLPLKFGVMERQNEAIEIVNSFKG